MGGLVVEVGVNGVIRKLRVQTPPSNNNIYYFNKNTKII